MLDLASREALDLGHEHIGTEHILLGLVRENEGVAARILLDLDADWEEIRTEVIRVLSGGAVRRPRSGGQSEGSGRGALTFDERGKALERANRARVERARIKRGIKSGAVDPAKLFLDPPSEMLTAKPIDFLLAVPRYGRVRANRVLKQARISPRKTFAGLSERQRHELVDWLRRPRPDPSEEL